MKSKQKAHKLGSELFPKNQLAKTGGVAGIWENSAYA